MTDPTPTNPSLRVLPPSAGQADSPGEGQGTSSTAGLQELLAQAGTQDRSAWAALLRADQLRRWQGRRPLPVEVYLEQVPGLREDEEAVLDLVWGEFLLRQHRGEQPRLEEYLERFPAQEEQLRIHFSLDQLLADEPASGPPAEVPVPAAQTPLAGPEPDTSPAATGCPAGLATAGPAAPPFPGEDPSSGGAASPSPSGSRPFLPQTACTGPDLRDRGSAAGTEVVSPRVQVADYEVLGELGRGGMGVVYKAFHLRLKREVALKMILAGSHATPHQLERFKREAESVARLQHPHIVQIYEVGEHQGLPFFALEFVEGGGLDRCIAGTPQPARAAAVLLEKLARAMHAAHQRRIVHRDLKPANVLLGRKVDGPASGGSTGASGKALSLDGVEPKITDFGLAKQLDDVGMHTASDAVMGTPSYMAPEQAQGRARDIGPVTDVYALGAILYELLTGRPPFKGATTLDTLAQVCGKEPVAPHQLQPGVPCDLETICLKCLEKEPRRRYASALNLAEDLRRFLAREPIQARPVGSLERAWKWMRRRPRDAALVAISVVALVSLMGGALLYQRQEVRAAEEELARSRRADELRDQMQKLMDRGQEAAATDDWPNAQLAYANALAMIDSEPVLEAFRPRAEQRLADCEHRLSERQARADARQKYERFLRLRDDALFYDSRFTGMDLPTSQEATRSAARQALDLFGLARDGSKPAEQSRYVDDQTRKEIQAGGYELLLILAEATARPLPGESGRAQARQALALLDRAKEGLHAPTRAYHLRRAGCLILLGNRQGAEEERKRAAALGPASALDYFLLGHERYQANDFGQAIEHFDAALQREPNHFWAQYLMALCYLGTQQPAEARASLTACLHRRPDFVWLYLLRGFSQGELAERARSRQQQGQARRQFEAAEADFRRAQEILASKANREAEYALLVNRGVLGYRQKKLAEAAESLRAAIRLKPGQFNAYVNLARVYQEQEQPRKARDQLNKAIQLQPRVAALYRLRAGLDLELKELLAALEDHGRALELEPKGSPLRVEDHVGRGRIFFVRGEYGEAVREADAALKVRPRHAGAYRLRAGALVELKQYREAERSFSLYLEHGPAQADVLETRGLTRAMLGRYSEAIDDYTAALALRPTPETRAQRGWAYLMRDAAQLALEDFEAVLKEQPGNADAHNARGLARARLGQHWSALEDAEEALRRGGRNPLTVYNAARVYARVAGHLQRAGGSADRKGQEMLARCQERAAGLVREALELVAEGQRAQFWRQYVQADTMMDPVRPARTFGRLAARYASARR